MRLPLPVALASALLALAPAPAGAQQAGLALPAGGAASAEEPAGLTVNPAGIGFVRGAALQGFHEERAEARATADGLYFAAGGPLAAGLGLEWIRPGTGDGARYRKTTLAFALGDGHLFALGAGWSWYASPEPARDALRSLDLGLTLRPWRHLSIGAAAAGLEARLAGDRLPVRWDVGAATRFLDDTLTLSADLLVDDRSGLREGSAALGLGVETRFGLGLAARLLLPIHRGPGDATTTLVALTWNGPHGGVTAGTVARSGSTGWLGGFRASAERYRSLPVGGEVVTIDLSEGTAGPSPLRALFGERDPWLELLKKLELARDSSGIEGVVVRIGPLEVGRARAEELRARIAEIAARKPVLAWLTGGGTKEYLVAAAATAVAVPPSSAVTFDGIGTEALYLKGALDRAGLAFDVVRVGAWKSAPEPLTRTEGSPEARAAIEALLDDVTARDLAWVAAARHLPPEKVKGLADRALFTAEEAKAAGLVDEVLWPDELRDWARRRVGPGVELAAGFEPGPDRAALRWGDPPTIGIVVVEGTIVTGRSRRDPLGGRLAGADSVAEALRRASDDGAIRAVVLRIESGGGDGLASDLIWREVVQLRKKKPVVVSMGDLAASGGYLAAVGADAIVAGPSTLTGSIGVFALKPDLSGLLERLGVRREPHARGERALLSSIEKPWSPAERAAMQAQVDAFYARFVERVAAGRKLPREKVEEVAQGHVWTGAQAKERGLVDRLGTLRDAVELARERAGIPAGAEAALRRLDAPGAFAQRLGAAASALSPERALLDAAARVPELRALAALGELGAIVALPP